MFGQSTFGLFLPSVILRSVILHSVFLRLVILRSVTVSSGQMAGALPTKSHSLTLPLFCGVHWKCWDFSTWCQWYLGEFASLWQWLLWVKFSHFNVTCSFDSKAKQNCKSLREFGLPLCKWMFRSGTFGEFFCDSGFEISWESSFQKFEFQHCYDWNYSRIYTGIWHKITLIFTSFYVFF